MLLCLLEDIREGLGQADFESHWQLQVQRQRSGKRMSFYVTGGEPLK